MWSVVVIPARFVENILPYIQYVKAVKKVIFPCLKTGMKNVVVSAGKNYCLFRTNA